MTEAVIAKFSPELEAELAEISLGLEIRSECSRKLLLNRFDGLLSGIGNCELVATSVTGKNVIGLELPVGWISELRAVAACARESDFL